MYACITKSFEKGPLGQIVQVSLCIKMGVMNERNFLKFPHSLSCEHR